jgi:putative oxidoreductase
LPFVHKIIATSSVPMPIPRLVVGLIFLSEGLQKFITPDATGAGRFQKIGFADAYLWASVVGGFEIVCGLLILTGLLTRVAALPLLVIMAVAFVATKVPTLVEKGFWTFVHDYRTDFAMTLLLLFILYYGGGNKSVDKKWYDKKQ